MRLWKAILLVNLALALGLAGGYLHWSREVRRLHADLASARQAVASRGAVGSWTAHGIVRLVLRDQQAIFLTHEAIPGLMEGMTMGFETADPRLLAGLTPGDRVIFRLEQRGNKLLVVSIQKEPKP
jgi:Cu/Ag efflux protein CusF